MYIRGFLFAVAFVSLFKISLFEFSFTDFSYPTQPSAPPNSRPLNNHMPALNENML